MNVCTYVSLHHVSIDSGSGGGGCSSSRSMATFLSVVVLQSGSYLVWYANFNSFKITV